MGLYTSRAARTLFELYMFKMFYIRNSIYIFSNIYIQSTTSLTITIYIESALAQDYHSFSNMEEADFC